MPASDRLLHIGTNLDLFRLRPDDTVTRALRRLAENGLGLTVVVDEDSRVLGTVTDSDIRRAALAGGGADTPVSDVMSRRSFGVGSMTAADEVLEVLARHRMHSVPVIEGGELVGVRSLKALPEGRPRTAVIMAGGRGERLRPVTDTVPKPLLRVGSKSIVERLILGLGRAGVEEVYLAVNYMAEVFEQRLGSGEQLGVTVRYVREEHPMGTAGALSLLPEAPTGPVLVANGDIVTSLSFAALFDFHRRHGGAITVAGTSYTSAIPYGVLRNADHHLLSIDEKPERRDFCSAGIYVLESDVLPLLAPKEALGMPELIAEVLAEGRPVNVFPILEGWYDIGEIAQFERVLVQFAAGEED